MIYQVDGWRYWYRRYFGWVPFQKCMVCDKWYWGGFPRWWVIKTLKGWRWGQTWQASWKDYCSQKCSDTELQELDKQYAHLRKRR
jgi:hypothetical protein